ncbi:hypothetical protein K7432_002564 [Basidiobolus ranarum]|uniref:Chitosanase n=1 Tax=Basidiobolus ranarum TaxID=34480 RepID=A0ABR2X1B0_9FUNG
MKNILFRILLIASIGILKTKSEALEYCVGEYSKNHKECPLYRAKSTNCEEHANMPVTGNFIPFNHSINTLIFTITNVFEYGTTTYDYESCVDLNDSRGYTCGLVGFTTGTGDVFTVINRYLQINPNSELKTYYVPLKELADPRECGGPEVDPKKLSGFPEAWRRVACTDSKFKRVQEAVTNEMYFEPAMKLAESYKVLSPLGKSIFYDTAVQHGYDKDDGISLRSIIKMVRAEPTKAQTELTFLKRFLHFRKRILCCRMDDIWPESANRVSDLEFLLSTGNLKLSTPVVLPSYNDIKINGDEITDQPCSASNSTIMSAKPAKVKETPGKPTRRSILHRP